MSTTTTVYSAVRAACDEARRAARPPTGGCCAAGRVAMRRAWYDLEQIAARLEPFTHAGEHRP